VACKRIAKRFGDKNAEVDKGVMDKLDSVPLIDIGELKEVFKQKEFRGLYFADTPIKNKKSLIETTMRTTMGFPFPEYSEMAFKVADKPLSKTIDLEKVDGFINKLKQTKANRKAKLEAVKREKEMEEAKLDMEVIRL